MSVLYLHETWLIKVSSIESSYVIWLMLWQVMYSFLDRLISLALPRTRYFQSVSPSSFDGNGNCNIGVKDQSVFPEIRLLLTLKRRSEIFVDRSFYIIDLMRLERQEQWMYAPAQRLRQTKKEAVAQAQGQRGRRNWSLIILMLKAKEKERDEHTLADYSKKKLTTQQEETYAPNGNQPSAPHRRQ